MPRLKVADANARVLHNGHCSLNAFGKWRWRHFFHRVAGADHPPDFIQVEPFQRLQRDIHVPRMRRIERPAKDTNFAPLNDAAQTKTLPETRSCLLINGLSDKSYSGEHQKARS